MIPSIVCLPAGPDNRVWSGTVQSIVSLIGADFPTMAWSTEGGPPLAGVNFNVTSSAVGMRTEVLAVSCAGEKIPLPLTTKLTV